MKILINNKINTICIGLLAFVFSIMFYYCGHNIVSSLILIITSFILVYINKKEYGYYTNPVGVFSGIWFLTIGFATLRLHHVQVEWKFMTWICLIIAFVLFLLGYYSQILNFLKSKFKKNQNKIFDDNKKTNLYLILIVFFSSLISIIIECFVCEIPMFSKDIYSYTNFGVFGLRYFGVSSALVLPLSCLYIAKFRKLISKKEWIFLIIINILMLFVPFLIVSRGLVLSTLFFTLFTLCSIYKKKELFLIPIMLLIILFSWKTIGNLKNMDDAYLNKAFYMNLLDNNNKDNKKENITEKANMGKKTSSAITIKNIKLMRTYMFLCLNYDNFDLNVNDIKYTYGKSSFYPIYIIAGLKFITQMEDPREKLKRIMYTYNTFSILFLPYMDFGVIGIAFFMFIMGCLCFFFESVYSNIMFCSFLKYCCLFSFFSPYLIYPPTIIFYIAFLIFIKNILIAIINKYFN